MMAGGCRAPAATTATIEAPQSADPAAQPTARLEATVQATAAPTVLPPEVTIAPVPTAFYAGPLSPSCGQLLPAVPPPAPPETTQMAIDAAKRILLQQSVPAAAWPALERLLDAPATVGLVAFQLGQSESGVYLNSLTPMPLASVVKLVTLVAYAEAVTAGELDPLEAVPLEQIERFYLPRFDLGAHQRAVNDLRASGRVSAGDDPSVLLEDVAWMMIRHSSNAASDYLHDRLGQTRIEQTAVDLGLTVQSAPCPFIGQFLLMANHARGQVDDMSALRAYVTGEALYGAEVSLLGDAYSQSVPFREEEVTWREQSRRPNTNTQRYFTENLNAQGSAGDYADLMARLAQNGLTSPDSSFIARRILEWPNLFPANQELFSNVGYKNGSLPGVLTTAYYAYRWDESAPVVVVLFYRDLPQQTYRQWRRDLPHDELARWLLSDPAAIPLLHEVLVP